MTLDRLEICFEEGCPLALAGSIPAQIRALGHAFHVTAAAYEHRANVDRRKTVEWRDVAACSRVSGSDLRGEAGKQDKGIVSQTLPNDCLHIVFSRDAGTAARDGTIESASNPLLSTLMREIPAAGAGKPS